MHVICLLSQKGGAGKSTVVQSLAVCAEQHNQRTLIVELDPQGTLKDWSDRREAEHPKVLQTLPQSLGDVLEDARSNGVDWVFIDTPGHHNPAAITIAANADLILIPCKILSTKDVDAILPTIAEAERAQKPAYVLMNQVPPNAPKLVRNRQIRIQEEYGIKVLSLSLSRRADFEYCDALGLSAGEFNPAGPAAQEITKLYVLVQVILQVAKAVESTSGIAYRPRETEPDTTESLESNETEINEAGATDAFQPRIPAGIVESED
ncbi:MAG: ParA family protein [Gammaproteobacteria bacterium]|nr:ParA family protein [Gammaproteobacteria bacterium]